MSTSFAALTSASTGTWSPSLWPPTKLYLGKPFNLAAGGGSPGASSGAKSNEAMGIQLTAGNLVLRNSTLELLTTGLLVGNNSATAHADVINTDFFGNGTAMITNGAGVNTAAGGNPPFTGTQTMLRMNGVNIIDNATAFAMQHAAADVNQNCKYTFWNYQGSVINVTGDTTFFTFSPSNPPFNCNVQSYSTGTASN